MILIIILTCVILTCIYVIINLVRKNERLDDEIDEANLYVIDIFKDLQKLQEDMDDIDSRGGFKADDETGHVFKELQELITRLNEKYSVE